MREEEIGSGETEHSLTGPHAWDYVIFYLNKHDQGKIVSSHHLAFENFLLKKLIHVTNILN